MERELIDRPDLDTDELETNLREMAFLNRLPGGVGTSLRVVRGLLAGAPDPSVLDVGTGSGDFARRMARSARVIAAELHPRVLAVARRELASVAAVRVIEADARALPLPDGAVDVAHASLLLHHLDPDDACAALAELRRVARRAVVVNDLHRGLLPYLGTAAAVLALTRGRYTRHDGIVSARRAYTLAELDAVAAQAGMHPAWRSWPLWPRVTTVYRRHGPRGPGAADEAGDD